MSRVSFTPQLSQEYQEIFTGAAIRPAHRPTVSRLADRIFAAAALARYTAVAVATGVPAHVVGILHSLECGLAFTGHLHNGDPLTGRTVHVPAGRPISGKAPFSWEQSAIDALCLHRLDAWDDWSVPGTAYVLERYNGFGYRLRRPPIRSPYLWGATTAYTSGKYVADHVWSPTAVSRQCGGMALLRVMMEAGRPGLPSLPVGMDAA